MSQATVSPLEAHSFVKNIHGVRYQAKDVARAVAFYDPDGNPIELFEPAR